jgi:hypothetical protein
MGHGPAPKPEYACYQHLPTGQRAGNHLYVIEFSDGLVKVGRSVCPRDRIKQHHKQMAEVGRRIRRYAFYRSPHGYSDCERELLDRLLRFAAPIRGMAEWFYGLRYEVAANLAKQMSGRQFIELSYFRPLSA